jgi:hypothetical protein
MKGKECMICTEEPSYIYCMPSTKITFSDEDIDTHGGEGDEINSLMRPTIDS